MEEWKRKPRREREGWKVGGRKKKRACVGKKRVNGEEERRELGKQGVGREEGGSHNIYGEMTDGLWAHESEFLMILLLNVIFAEAQI